jgi:hypothetical protein
MNIKHVNEALRSVAAAEPRPKARAGRGRWLTAGLLLAILAPGAPARAQGDLATADLDKEVTALYDQGLKASRTGQWEKARKALLAAFERAPHFQIAANLGRAELMAGKPRDAAEHLSFFLREAKDVRDEDRLAAEKMLSSAKAKVGTVAIQVDTEGAVVLVDGQKVGTSPLAGPVFVEPGNRRVEAQKEGRSPASQALQVAAGSEPKVEFKLTSTVNPAMEPGPAPTPQAPLREAGSQRSKALIGAGIGVSAGLVAVGAATAIGAALTEQASLHDWDSGHCTSTNPSCAKNFDAQEDRRFYLGNTAVWAFAGAGVVAGATVIYALTGRSAASKSTPSGALWVSPQGGGLAVTGSF